MNSKKVVLTLIALAMSACGGGGGMTMDPVTVTYIVSTADLPEVMGDTAVGFNLDGAVGTGASAACNDALDYTSPTGEVGVDNSLASVAGLLAMQLMGGIPANVQEQIASGAFLLLMEVSDIESFTNDTDGVSVRLYLGALPAGTTMAMLGADGRLTAGQTFTEMMSLATVSGTITGGNLSISSPSLPLRLDVMGMTVSLNLTQARIGGRITRTGMTGGMIGAQLSISELVMVAARLGLPVDEMTIRTFVTADLDPVMGGMVCNAISVGLTFEATTANPTAM